MATHSSTRSNIYAADRAQTGLLNYPASRIATFVVLAMLGCTADLVSKWWLFSRPPLRQGAIWWVVPDYAGFQLSLNEGALFGMGQGLVWLFALLSIVAAIAIPIWLFRYGAAADVWVTVALGCVTGGILGNLFDRLGLHGETWFFDPARAGETAYAVRDWILLQWSPQHRWPNFNIADSLLVVGAGIILVRAMTEKQEGPGEPKSKN